MAFLFKSPCTSAITQKAWEALFSIWHTNYLSHRLKINITTVKKGYFVHFYFAILGCLYGEYLLP